MEALPGARQEKKKREKKETGRELKTSGPPVIPEREERWLSPISKESPKREKRNPHAQSLGEEERPQSSAKGPLAARTIVKIDLFAPTPGPRGKKKERCRENLLGRNRARFWS